MVSIDTLSKKHKRQFHLAYNEAICSEMYHKLGATIVMGGKIMGSACNCASVMVVNFIVLVMPSTWCCENASHIDVPPFMLFVSGLMGQLVWLARVRNAQNS